MKFDEVLSTIRRGSEEILLEEELREKLRSKKKLRIKLGLDPTAPDLHLGHTVVLNKLKQFQDLGHEVLFLIGDFTALIGDPSGKNETRPHLSAEQVKQNALTYQKQVSKILDPSKTQIMFNSEWMNKLNPADIIRLASTYTVARMLERDDFHKRFTSGLPIAIHEFLYPLIQGYDSVAMQADIELGGTDQKFNLLMGRELQKHFGQKPQIIMTFPLLPGLDGIRKMSKSLDNYIGIDESADQMFGKIMSISDETMWLYYELLSFKTLNEIQDIRDSVAQGMNPRDAKFLLAEEIVARFHSEDSAKKAKENFINRFQKGIVPEDLTEIFLQLNDPDISPRIKLMNEEKGLFLYDVIKLVFPSIKSNSEAIRLISQGGVHMDGQRITDRNFFLASNRSGVLKVGKKLIAKVRIE